jgi:hypothetical protein
LVLDTFRIPLNKFTFILVPIISIVVSLLVWRKYYFKK